MIKHLRKEKRKAFTLVELLVVIAIIGLLSTVAVVAMSSAKMKSRNAKRVSDMRQLVTAFNLAVSNGGSLPSSGGNVWVCISSSCYGTWGGYGPSSVDAFLSPYISPKLSDPRDNVRAAGGYLYNGAFAAGPSGSGAYLEYVMEGDSYDCGIGKLNSSYPTFYSCFYKLEPY